MSIWVINWTESSSVITFLIPQWSWTANLKRFHNWQEIAPSTNHFAKQLNLPSIAKHTDYFNYSYTDDTWQTHILWTVALMYFSVFLWQLTLKIFSSSRIKVFLLEDVWIKREGKASACCWYDFHLHVELWADGGLTPLTLPGPFNDPIDYGYDL